MLKPVAPPWLKTRLPPLPTSSLVRPVTPSPPLIAPENTTVPSPTRNVEVPEYHPMLLSFSRVCVFPAPGETVSVPQGPMLTMPEKFPPAESTVCPNGALNVMAWPVKLVNTPASIFTGTLKVTSPAGTNAASGMLICAAAEPLSNVYAVSQARKQTDVGETAPCTVTVADETSARSGNMTLSP